MQLQEHEVGASIFLKDVIAGLSQADKVLSCKYLYDEKGSRLFCRICELEEYYPTRTEMAILENNVTEMAPQLGPRCLLIEPGSGSSAKTRLLLEHLEDPVAYVPIDISKELLFESAAELGADISPVEVLPVCADFNKEFELPEPRRTARRRVLYFPGSTIGNFDSDSVGNLLEHFIKIVGQGGGLLVGIDLRKDRETLERAYNDAQGVTAEFNMNILHRINRELGADFNPESFRYVSFYNEEEGRVEMHLESTRDQEVHVAGRNFSFDEGERVCTEHSNKFEHDTFAGTMSRAGGKVEKIWTDDQQLFSVVYATVR